VLVNVFSLVKLGLLKQERKDERILSFKNA